MLQIDRIQTALTKAGRAPLPLARARRLAGVLTYALDARDVREAAWRARDVWLYWDYAALEAAGGTL